MEQAEALGRDPSKVKGAKAFVDIFPVSRSVGRTVECLGGLCIRVSDILCN